MNIERNPVFTIGHSNHDSDEFLALLRQHGVNVVVDVRSAPYSRYLPHFNKDFLTDSLQKIGIRYDFQGKELGGQPSDRAYYDADGRIMYHALAETDAFKHGIERILASAAADRIALTCSEKEPLDCHRTLLISQALAKRGVAPAHIHADGSLESHADAMDRLLDDFKLPHNGDLFRSREAVIDDAVARRAQRVGARWRDPSAGGADWGRAL